MIQIDKGIPVPRPREFGAPQKWPWKSMGVGDSFLAEGMKPHHFRAQAVRAAKKHGVKFTVRAVDSGVRVWRIA